MKTLIIYKSNTGHTKEYAEMLSKNLKCKAVPLNQFSKNDLLEYERIVFGGWVRASMIVGLNKFVKQISKGMNKKVVIFAVGASEASEQNTSKLIEKNNVINQINCPFFYLQGGFDPEKLKFPLRGILKNVAKSLKKKQAADPESLSQEDKDFLEFFQNKHNDVDSQNLEKIEACLQYIKTDYE